MPNLSQRYHAHLNEYFAEWGVPDDLRYAPQGKEQEPTVFMSNGEASIYIVWLERQGYITAAERRWLWDDIAAQEAGSAGGCVPLVAPLTCACCQASDWRACPYTKGYCPRCWQCKEHCRCAVESAERRR